MSSNIKRVLIGCTGSVASIKLIEIINQFRSNTDFNYEIKIIATEHSKHFFDPTEIPADCRLYNDADEWASWEKRGDPVLHIELGKWADVMIIAPLDANTLAKWANGICDNLLLCTTRAWDITKPLIFCPAMNTRMWEHPITKEHLEKLKSWGHMEIPCVTKVLMCGDHGNGAMAQPDTIFQTVHKLFLLESDCF